MCISFSSRQLEDLDKGRSGSTGRSAFHHLDPTFTFMHLNDSIEIGRYRTTQDIWKHILVFAISCPLLPSQHDNLINSIRILHRDCEDSEDVRKAEAARANLQLVCRLWNELLQPHGERYWRAEWTSRPPQHPVSRVEIGTFEYDCSCPMPRPNSTINTLAANKVEALISADISEPLGNEVARYPNLQLFAKRMHQGQSDFSSLATSLSKLTHLRLWSLFPTLNSDHPLDLPRLHTLSIDFSPSQPTQKSKTYEYPRFSRWNLSNLANLAVTGTIKPPSPASKPEQDVKQLIQNVGSTIRGLSFTLKLAQGQSNVPCPIPENLWKQCTQLKAIHGSLITLIDGPRPPFSYSPIQVILSDLHHTSKYRFDEEVLYRLYIANSWPISSLGMDIGWSTMRNQLKDEYLRQNLEPLAMAYQFFNAVRSSKYKFKDRYDIGMDSSVAKEFLDWLENPSGLPADKVGTEGGKSFYDNLGFLLGEEPEAEFTDSEEDYTSSEGDEDYDESEESLDFEGDDDEEDEDYVDEDEEKS
ncbi:hypothetical protein CPB86DRAFT_281907 [Serendipita vermifera]|nr:hypothetical protein CPB86DRAFT_281907 [Serendipita vermifera]